MWPFETKAWYLRPVEDIQHNDPLVSRDSTAQRQREACDFIEKIALRLRFPFRTCASAQLYFHLFFATHSMTEYPPMDIALTSILVASKAEETYKRIRQILSAAFLLLHPDFTGDETEVRIVEDHRLRVTQYEHLVLEAAGYEFAIRHAHEVLLELTTEWRLGDSSSRTTEKLGTAFEMLRKVYLTPLVLAYPPEYIALASLRRAFYDDPKVQRQVAGVVADLGIRSSDLERLLAAMDSMDSVKSTKSAQSAKS